MTGAECRRERERLGISIERLATRAGVATRTVLRLELGMTRPRPVTLVAVRKALRLLAEDARPGA